MATELGSAYVQIVPSAQGISGRITKALGGEANEAGITAGQSFAGKFASFASKAIAAVGIGKLINESLTQGSELEQSIGGVETLFKASARKVQEYASQAYKTTGLSANEYMQNVTGFSASLLQSLSGDTDKAAEIANTAMIDMADNANKMGTNMQDIQNAYQGFAKQNYTMLDNLKLGYGGTKKEMERLLQDATKLSGIEYNIDNLNDVYEAIHVIQGELGITGTTAKEASATMQGSLVAMKSAFKDVLGAMATGADLKGPLTALGETVVTFVKGNLFPMLSNVILQLPTIVINTIQTAGPELLQAGMELITNVVNGLGGALPTLIPQITAVVLTLVQTFIDNLPHMVNAGIMLITGLAEGLINAIPILLEKLPEIITSIIDTLLKAIPKIIDTGVKLLGALADDLPTIIQLIVKSIPILIKNIIQAIKAHLPEIMKAGVNLLTSLIKNLPEIILTIVSAIPEIIFGIVAAISMGIPDLIDIGKNLIIGLWKGICALKNWLWEKIRGFFESIWNGIKNFFGIASPSKKFAWIGQMNMEGLAEGLEDHIGEVRKAMDKVQDETSRSLESGLNFTVRDHYAEEFHDHADNLPVRSIKQDEGIKSILDLLSELISIIKNNALVGDVVLDSGALVGELTASLDESLAQKRLNDEFGGGNFAPVF